MKRIPLHGKNGRGLFALVDDADYERLSQFHWFARPTISGVYPTRNRMINGRRVKWAMHWDVIGRHDTLVADHINRDPLDNRRSNLRHVSRSENQANARSRGGSCRFKGVERRQYDSGRVRFRAGIRLQGKNRALGHFDCAVEAARAYDAAARRIYGPCAAVNFPRNGEAHALAVPSHVEVYRASRRKAKNGEAR